MAISYSGCGACGRYRGVLSPNKDGSFSVECRDCGHQWGASSKAIGQYKTQQHFKEISKDISTEEYDQAIGVSGGRPYGS